MTETTSSGCLPHLTRLDDGFVELRWTRGAGTASEPTPQETVAHLAEAVQSLRAMPGLRGVLVSSVCSGTVLDTNAPPLAADRQALAQMLVHFEDLHVPTVAAMAGHQVGLMLALALAASQRLMTSSATARWPEVTLGQLPGSGSAIRLPRLTGLATALDWVCSGLPVTAEAALQAGLVDALASPSALRAQALLHLAAAARGEIDWRARQQRKRQPLLLTKDAVDSVTEPRMLQLRARQAPHQPAAQLAAQMMQTACLAPWDLALQLEAEALADAITTQAASALLQTARNEQQVRQTGLARASAGRPLRHAAVLGAGAMGGEIALSAALAGMTVRLKDIVQAPLDIGMANARRQVDRLVKASRLSVEQATATLAAITPQLDDSGMGKVDIVIEAVAENLAVKQAVLRGLQAALPPGAIIASNTSSLGIDELAQALDRPDRVVGMHFFNPASMMPLVEVIPGPRTSPQVVADTVGCCVAMGKVPIVVKDTPGFLVNRVFTAFMRGFLELLVDGADFNEVDRAMQAFGWPLGPAALHDMLGIDICNHACDTISAGYAGHMPFLDKSVSRLMLSLGRLGCKSGIGFYSYETDARGRQRRSKAPDTPALLATLQPHGLRHHSDADIVDRMMVPLVLESIRALDDGIVDSAAELDTALLMGLGLPAYLGGALVYADWLGADELLRRADRLGPLGPMYQAPDSLRQMQRDRQTFYPDGHRVRQDKDRP